MTTQTTTNLLPIIATYWGNECSYTSQIIFTDSQKKLGGYELGNIYELDNFKLHLRPLWEITEEELKEIGKLLNLEKFREKIASKVVWSDEFDRSFTIYADDDFEFNNISSNGMVKTINHLRSKGFCLDRSLINAGLVQWKEVENG